VWTGFTDLASNSYSVLISFYQYEAFWARYRSADTISFIASLFSGDWRHTILSEAPGADILESATYLIQKTASFLYF
jgi:hypothetical protein